MAWLNMRRLVKVNVSEMTARQPSVPKWMVIQKLQGGISVLHNMLPLDLQSSGVSVDYKSAVSVW
ncbi:MAG: hypothetical protein FD146_183 [Anaerolineaceae bacterium]|nr:MAG: hypothetical protein FD146_183 [Anaerolineaceae bacterium]